MTDKTELIARLRDFSQAYPHDVFPELSIEEKNHLVVNYSGTIDRISAGMGRHFSKFATQAADALETAQAEIERLNTGWQAANQLLLQRSGDLQSTHMGLSAALARLAEIEGQEPIGMICGKRIEPNGTSEFFGFYFDKDYNPTLKEKIYAAAAASPQPVQPSNCRQNPLYSGPSQCIKGTAGCAEPHDPLH